MGKLPLPLPIPAPPLAVKKQGMVLLVKCYSSMIGAGKTTFIIHVEARLARCPYRWLLRESVAVDETAGTCTIEHKHCDAGCIIGQRVSLPWRLIMKRSIPGLYELEEGMEIIGCVETTWRSCCEEFRFDDELIPDGPTTVP